VRALIAAVLLTALLAGPVAAKPARYPACVQTGTPVLNAGVFSDYWTGVGVSVTGLTRGQAYALWAASYDVTSQGYAVGPTVVAGANGRATLWFDAVEAGKLEWDAYVYTVPGTPSTTSVAICDVDVP
jgi:hypothetical protein